MAKGQSVPYEIRDEVSKALFDYYSGDTAIASISPKFLTDHFPYKGQAYIYFEGSSDYFLCSFKYFYDENSVKTLSVTRDWRD